MKASIQCPKCLAEISLNDQGICKHCHHELSANEIISSLFTDEYFTQLGIAENHSLRTAYAYYSDGNLKKAEECFKSVDRKDSFYVYAYLGYMLCISDGFEIAFAPFKESYPKAMQTILKQMKNHPTIDWISFILNRYLLMNSQLYDKKLAEMAVLKQKMEAEKNAKENKLRSLELKKAAKIQKKREKLPTLKVAVFIGIWLITIVLNTWGFVASKASYWSLLIPLLIPYIYCIPLIPLISYSNNEKKFYGFSLLLLIILYPFYFASMLLGMLILNDLAVFSFALFKERLLVYAIILGVFSLIQFIVFIYYENKLHKKIVKFVPANSFEISLDESALNVCEAKALEMDEWLNHNKKEILL